MTLHWIVPGRRAVVVERVAYTDVISAWIAALREDQLRSKLLDWYGPISSVSSSAMASLYDATVDAIERWAEQFFSAESVEREHSHSLGDPATINHEGFWLRLWKGPYRVLHEHRAGIVVNPDNFAEIPLGPIEIDAGGAVVLRFDSHRRVLNPDATLLIGDVIELPVFRLMWRCGVRSFEDAHFNGAGSFMLGTSVTDANGDSPGRVRIHDNLAAMRFQLLLNLARGAFYSLEPGLSGSMLRKSNHLPVEGHELYARGVLYGGSLGSTYRRASGEDAAYLFADNQWATAGATNAPTKTSLDELAANTRLTTAWACTPCALGLASYMTTTVSGPAYGGVNKTLRCETTVASLRENFTLHYFDIRMYGVTPSYGRDSALTYLFRQAGGSGTPSVDFLRERALTELFGERARRQVTESEAEQDTAAVAEAGESARESEEDVEAPHLREPDPPAAMALDLDTDATEALDDPVDEVLGGLEVEADEPLDWSLFLPPDQEVSLTRSQMLEYFDGALNAVGLNGHEYTIVRLEKHERLLDLAATEQGPPVTGPLAAYNPLDGTSYHLGGDDEADLYIFEASGVIMPTCLGGELSLTAFELRPARWTRVETVYFKANRRGTLYIGEGDAIGMTGANHHTRDKSLISIAKLSRARLDAIHGQPAAHLRVSLQVQRNELENRSVLHDFPDRAVPYHTLDESSADEQFATIETANATRRTLAGRLTNAAVRRAVTASISASQINNRANLLRAQALASVRNATRAVTRLRRQLASRYAPDPGMTDEQPVEQRSSFRAALHGFIEGAGVAQSRVDEAQSRLDTSITARREAHGRVLSSTGAARAHAREEVQLYSERRDTARADLSARRRELARCPGGPERDLDRQARIVNSDANRVEGVDWHARARDQLIAENSTRVLAIRNQLNGTASAT